MKHALKQHNINTLTAFFIIFSMVCAGGYGLEDSISGAGPGITLLLLMILPFFWSIPMGLVSAELGSAIPEEGGFYKWVQRALGEFWGFLAGWWWSLSMYVDSTLYIVLTSAYLQSVLDLSDLQAFLLKAGIVLVFTIINLVGIKEVGKYATVLSLIVIASFLLLTVLSISKWQYNPFVPIIGEGQTFMGSIGIGLAICMWTYSGYEAISTVAGEVKNPQVIPRAILLSIPIIMFLFVVPTAASLAAVGNWQDWGTEGGISFVTAATRIGFPVFGWFFALAAIASNLSLYNAFLAAGSRSFYAMALDNLAPKFYLKVNKRFGTPHVAIICMAAVNLILCQYGFDTLVVIDVFLVMFAEMLILISVIVLRKKEPDLTRPYKIPFGIKGLTAFCIPPIVICIIALFTNGWDYLIGGIIGAVSGPIAYYIFKGRYGGVERESSQK